MAVFIPCPKCGGNLENGIQNPCPHCGWESPVKDVEFSALGAEQFAGSFGKLQGKMIRISIFLGLSIVLNIVLAIVVIGLIVALALK